MFKNMNNKCTDKEQWTRAQAINCVDYTYHNECNH